MTLLVRACGDVLHYRRDREGGPRSTVWNRSPRTTAPPDHGAPGPRRPRTTATRITASGSPGCRAEVLEEASVHVRAGLALDDRVVDAGGAVHEIERGVESLLGQPHLGVVRPFVGDPPGVDGGHEDTVGE